MPRGANSKKQIDASKAPQIERCLRWQNKKTEASHQITVYRKRFHKRHQKQTGQLGFMPFMYHKLIALANAIRNCQIKALIFLRKAKLAPPDQKNKECNGEQKECQF